VKRSDALAPLSRDHHQALAVALRLRRATTGDVDEAAGSFEGFWGRYGDRHFAIEEELLLPAVPAGTPGWPEAAQRIRDEHTELRARARALLGAGEASVQSAHLLGSLLEAHVRYEEREAFGIAEDALSPSDLEALGEAIAAAEAEDG